MSDPFDVFEKLTDLLWMDALLVEGVRADTIRQAYVDKIPAEDLKTLEDEDPTDGKKYFAWMAKQYVAEPGDVYFISGMVKRFEEDKLHKIIKGNEGDINKYKSVLDLRKAIVAAEASFEDEKARLNKEKSVKREQRLSSAQTKAFNSGDAEKVFDGNKAMVIKLNSDVGAKAFQNTPADIGFTWCFTRAGEKENHWREYYIDEHCNMYIIWDKTQDNHLQYAIAINPEGGVQLGDVDNNQLDEYELDDILNEFEIPREVFEQVDEDEAADREDLSTEALIAATEEAVRDGKFEAWQDVYTRDFLANFFYEEAQDWAATHRSVEQSEEDIKTKIFDWVSDKIKVIVGGIPPDVDTWSWEEVVNSYANDVIEEFIDMFLTEIVKNV